MQTSIANIATLLLCIAALAGCDRAPVTAKNSGFDTAVLQPPGKAKRRTFHFATNCEPHGNETTLQYFHSVNQQHANYAYCNVVLDDAGDCTELALNICYEPKGIDIEKMLLLPKLQKVLVRAETVTDEHLVSFEQMHSLKNLNLAGYAEQMTPEGIERLKKARPDLEVEVRFRNRPGTEN